jgi:hypothetical protein
MKRLITVLLAALCLLSPVSSAAYALDLRPSNLTVVMKYGDAPLGGINVTACRVAEAKEESGGFSYRAVPAFAGAGANFTGLTREKNIALAASLHAYAAARNIPRSLKATGSDGKAAFLDLPAGLYLVAQAQAGNSEYSIAPYLVSVPVMNERLREWDYNVTAYPKTEPVKIEVKTVSVSAYKVWAGTDRHPGSVQVQLYRNGTPQGEPKALNGGNYWRCVWDGLAPGDTWTVDEVNVPSGYTKNVSGNASTGFIITNTRSPQGPPPSNPAVPGKLTLPRTEDAANMRLWVTLIAVSLAGLLMVILMGKSKRAARAPKRG